MIASISTITRKHVNEMLVDRNHILLELPLCEK